MASLRLACLLLVTLLGNHVSAQEVGPLWKFNVGDEHRYRLTQQMDMEVSLGAANRDVKTEFRQTIDLTWNVEQVDDQGLAKIAQTVARVQMDLHAPGEQETHFDTDDKESPSGFAAMFVPLAKALTNEPIVLTITPRGEIVDVEIPAALTKSMQAIPGAAMMGDIFTQQGFQSMMQQSSFVLPESTDLNPGYHWTRKSKLNNKPIGVVQAESTYHYVGTRDVDGALLDVFTVEMQFDFSEDDDHGQIEVVDQQSNGELLFDRAAGHLSSSSLQQELTLKMGPGGDTATQKMTHNTRFSRITESTETDP